MHYRFLLLMAAVLHLPALAGRATPSLANLPYASIHNTCQQKGFASFDRKDGASYTHWICNGEHIISFERASPGTNNDAVIIVDQLNLPRLPRGHDVIFHLMCSSSLYPNQPVIAIGRWKKVKDGSEVRPITHAWRFDLQNRKIEPIPTRGMECSIDEP